MCEGEKGSVCVYLHERAFPIRMVVCLIISVITIGFATSGGVRVHPHTQEFERN